MTSATPLLSRSAPLCRPVLSLTSLFLAGLLLLAAGAAGPAWGQDPSEPALSSAERSKLDGRFERILRKARVGKLQSAIRSVEELAQRSAPSAVQRQREGQRRSLTERLRGEKRSETAQVGSRLPSALDVRPDGRAGSGAPVYEAVVQGSALSDLRVQGVTVVSVLGDFATVRATPQGLGALAKSEAVSKVRSPKTAEPTNDVGAAEVGARTLNSGAVGGTEYKGDGTLACIIDSGIDWSHPDFADENGNTRIRTIWDQVDDSTSVGTPVDNDPSRFRQNFNPDYGSEYLRSDIQAALDGSGSVNQEDVNGHGTHVAGTAASSGEAYRRSSGAKRYRGAAPGADIIAVKAGDGPYSFANVLNGVVYCQDVAQAAGKPVVINMSLGTDFAPHDGSGLQANALEQLSRPGSVTIASAGNSGSPFSPIHTQKSLPASDSVDVGIDVTQYTPNSGRLNDFYFTSLWTYQPGPYEVSVFTPEQQDTLTVTIDGSQAVRDTSVATPRGAIYLESSTEGNGRYFLVQSFDALESQPPAEGEWTVRTRHQGSSSTPVHGWFLGFGLGSGEGAGSAAFPQANNQFTIGSPATSRGAIAVGNYIQRTRWSTANQGPSIGIPTTPEGVITPSSSRGPTVDGRTRPAVAAPGTWTASALSDDASPSLGNLGLVGNGQHQMLLGTSMSAPLTAGSVALLLQENPNLSTDETRSLLKNTARVDDRVEARGGSPNQTFGAGKLNVLRAMTSLTGEAAPLEVLSYDQPADFDQDASVTLGGGAAKRAALRFTPTQSGRVAGTYLSLADNGQNDPANELSDSLQVEVWTDDGGVPGQQIGNSVAVAPSALRGFSPNFVSLSATGAAVQAGEDYHIVVSPEASGGTVELLTETVSPTSGRSTAFENGSWSPVESDLVVRVQIRRDVSAPPAVAGLTVGTAEPRNISLSWDEVSVPDLGEYLIYRDTSPIGTSPNFAPFDTTEAGTASYTDTTATEGQTYYYRVASLDRSGNESEAVASASAFLYPDQVQVQFSRSFGDGGSSSSDYRLLALPGTVDRDAGSVLSGQPGIDWSVLWDDGSEEDFLVEYDGSETFNFRPGRGFWAVSTQDLTVTDTLRTVSLQADTATTVPLHDGWNIISNPFGKPVPWSAVRAANGDQIESGSLQPPFGFEGSFSQRDTLASAETGQAFYFLNDQGLSQLTVPYPGAPKQVSQSGRALTAGKPAPRALSVTATPVGERGASSTVRVRSVSGSGAPPEVVAPTRRFDEVSLHVRDKSAENSRRKFLSATSRDLSEGQSIPLVLRADTSSVEVRAATEDLAGKSVALIRSGSGQVYELDGGRSVEMPVGDGSSRFKLAVGSDAYVDRQVESAAPESVRLTAAPNPLQKRTTIRYTLPEEASVRLDVYDVLGRRVATLVNARKKAGRHQAGFSAQDLSSGVYFGRLKVGQKIVTSKLTIVR